MKNHTKTPSAGRETRRKFIQKTSTATLAVATVAALKKPVYG